MKLSIIIVNWNTLDLLHQTLRSVYNFTSNLDFEIIVIDNHSSDKSIEMVKAEFPLVKLIINNENLGFSKANNQGLKLAQGEYLMLLNSDIVLKEPALNILVKYLDSHPEVAMVGPQLLNEDGTFQHACRRNLPNPISSFFHLFGFTKLFRNSKLINTYKRQTEDNSITGYTEAISGAAMMFRYDVYKRIGGLDEVFFFYGEDIDFCKRVGGIGGKIVYVSDARIIHLGGASSKKRRTQSLSNFYQAMWLYYKKHFYHQHNFFINGLVWLGIKIRLVIALLINLFKFQ